MFPFATLKKQSPEYLRLSVTDNYNFRPIYSVAENSSENKIPRIQMSPKEFTRLVRAFAKLGVRKVRIIGGEPGVRKDLSEIANSIASVPGIEELTVTTNGTALLPTGSESIPKHIETLRASGISRANINLDTLNEKIFEAINGRNMFSQVLNAIEASIAVKFPLKINSVVMKNTNDNELDAWKAFLKTHPVTVRFIELTPAHGNRNLYQQRGFPLNSWLNSLEREGWIEIPKSELSGPAREFAHPSFAGKIGFILPISQEFCSLCTRIQATNMGFVHTCPFQKTGHNVRHLLQSHLQESELISALSEIIAQKNSTEIPQPSSSLFTQNFSKLGN